MRIIRQYPTLCFVLMVVATVHLSLWPLKYFGLDIEILRALKLLFAITPVLYVFAIVYRAEGEEGANQLWKRFRWQLAWYWYPLAILGFTSLGFLAMGIRYAYDGFWPPAEDFGRWPIVLGMSLPLLLFPGFTEEFAWRGFLQERWQKKIPAWLSGILVGLVWGAWHYMDFLMENWNTDIAAQISFFTFITGASMLIGWFYWQTRSVWIAMLAHFSANTVFFFLPVMNLYEGEGRMTIYLYLALVWGAGVLVFVLSRKSPKQSELEGLPIGRND